MERYLVEAGYFAQPLRIVGDDRVIAPEHRSERMCPRFRLGDALLVEVIAEDIDAVGTGEVVEDVAVDVGDGDAGRGSDERARAEILLHQPAVLERHPVRLGELQVGDAFGGFRRQRASPGVAVRIEAREPEEGVLALGGDVRRRAVGAEEIVNVELVVRDQPRHGL